MQLLPYTIAVIFIAGQLLMGCSPQSDEPMNVTVQGAKQAVLTLDELSVKQAETPDRPGALLGVHITEFLSRGVGVTVKSALNGIDIQTALAAPETGDLDPDYRLLQAFGDALQVDIADLLNRSNNRQESLDRYTEALKNVGTRSTERFAELDVALENIRTKERDERREVSELNRNLRKAIDDKDFGQASEIQQSINEKQETLADTELEATQLENLHDIFDELLDIYAERILAIESNREALIAGITVVDVPGAEDIDVLSTPSRREQQGTLDTILNNDGSIDDLKL